MVFLLLLVGLVNASVNMSYDSTSKMWNLTNSYRSYYINATNAVQYTNHPGVYWSQNAWCFNSSITGFRCADTVSGFTWTNHTDSSTYALLVGTKLYTFTGGRTLRVTITYYLNDTDDWIQVVPNLNGNFNFVGQLIWRTHNIQIGGWKYWDWVRVWLTNGTNDYPLNTTDNQSFSSSTISNKSYYLYDSNTGEYAQTWWDRNLNLNIVKGAEYNDYMDLYNNISMSGTWQTNFTLWWVDAIPCYITCHLTAPPTNLLRKVGQLFTLSGHWHYSSGTCNPTASITGIYQNSTGSWGAINTTTNLSTTNTNPQTTFDGIDASWTVTAGHTDADVFAYYNVSFSVNNKGYACTVAPPSRQINVTYNSSCDLISSDTIFTASRARCQNITANNTVVDCNGFGVLSKHSIPYSTWGFRADNLENITIKNCLINDTRTGIYLKTVKNANLTNNTITNIYDSDVLNGVSGGWASYAFRIDYSNNTRIINDTVHRVYASGSGALGGGTGYGIELYSSNYTTAQNNSIDWLIGNYGEVGGGAKGIYLYLSNFNNFTKNKVNNSQDTLLYLYSGYNNSFTNNIYSNATYGVYFGEAQNLTVENEIIRGNGTNMDSGFVASNPAGTNSIRNITITNVTAYSTSACLYFTSYVILTNFTISNCSYGVYMPYNHGFLSNSTIAQTIYDYYGDYGTYNNTFLNVSFDRTKTYFDTANLTVQWYARVSVKDSAGSALTSTINVSSNLSQPVYYGYQSVSPYFIVNDTLFGSGATNYNNHSVLVNCSGYNTNLTYFNISYRDATINVTLYTAVPPDTTPPNVSITTPTYQQNVSGVISINATVNDSGGMDSSKVYYRINSSTTNVTGWIQMTNASSGGSNYYNATFNTSTIADGWYNVTVNATDLAGNQNSSVSQPFKIDNTAPALTFIYPTPANASNLSQTWVYVNVSVNEPADNCSLNWNTTSYWLLKFNSTVWYKNMTSLADGNYTYNATCNDTMGFNASTENRTVRLDTVAPTLTLVYPTPANNVNLSQSWVYVNVTISELSYSVLLNWSGTWYVMTSFNDSLWYLNRSGLADGTYFYTVLANDTVNNTGSTSQRNVTLDTVAPTLTWTGTTPATNSLQNSTSAYFNLTANENTTNCSMLFNNQWKIMNRWNSTNFYYSILGLADGQYIFNATCNDTAGNNGTTETRNFTVDSTPPVISFQLPTPANGATLDQDWVYINASSNEVTVSGLLNFNGTWYSMTAFNSTSWYASLAGLLNGTYTYNVTMNDSATNQGQSETRTVIIAYTPPPAGNVTLNFSDPQTMVKYEQSGVPQEFDWLPVVISVVTIIGIVIFA